MEFDFNEITDGAKFENLVVSYFEDLKNENEHKIKDVIVTPSGEGADGGRDLLVTFIFSNSITTFEKRLVVQCKFHSKNISPSKIADINIPALIHSYKAYGYLLVCKEKPTSKLTDLFERLERNCTFKYEYTIWNGEQFKRVILAKSRQNILQQYFPKYFNFCITNNIFTL